MELLVASNNPKKLAELQRILARRGTRSIRLLSLADVAAYPEPAETGRTFGDNALIKARAGVAATGLACIADDSGLSVAELNGMPGPLSARWSGVHGNDAANNELLLAQMRDVPLERRQAAFVSACALVTPDGKEHLAEGRWEGYIATELSGAGGFGYDPLFIPEHIAPDTLNESGLSAAELSAEQKNAVSHRGRALTKLMPFITALSV